MKAKTPLSIVPVVLGVVCLVGWSVRKPPVSKPPAEILQPEANIATAVDEVDRFFEDRWRESGFIPAAEADELQILRRLALTLHGTLPSLEEIRLFAADSAPNRLKRWTLRLLEDDRFADYFSERLARNYVGVEEGQFIIFRRDRFLDWLREQLKNNRPYDEMVREMIAGRGLWTGTPQTNFITAGIANEELDENKVAGRSVRAFLGQRMDCAQCHDHPFADWKQADFEGLAAHYGQARVSLFGLEDKQQQDGKPLEFEVEDRNTLEKRRVAPIVPFHPEWLPTEGTRRERLAGWITHRENRRFERAIANRIWGLLFGRPYNSPVDDLPDPPGAEGQTDDLLDILGADFREHGYDLQRLIQVIVASRPYQLASAYETSDPQLIEQLEEQWALFPMTRLRPEQVIGSMLQAGSLQTIDRNSHLFVRFIRAVRENDFVQEYGDLGEEELGEQSGTIPQALLRMNGELSQEISNANLLSASGRIASLAPSDESCLETCFLVCLTRKPSDGERAQILPQLAGTTGDARGRVVEDLYWSLFNSHEFSWNH